MKVDEAIKEYRARDRWPLVLALSALAGSVLSVALLVLQSGLVVWP